MRAIEAVRNGSATNGGISNARDRLRESAQNEQTTIALNNLLNETQKNAMVLVEDNARLRAKVATLTAELARVKALVEGAPVEWRRYKECRTGLIYNDRHSISGEYELIELIARPNLNLEQKP